MAGSPWFGVPALALLFGVPRLVSLGLPAALLLGLVLDPHLPQETGLVVERLRQSAEGLGHLVTPRSLHREVHLHQYRHDCLLDHRIPR